MKSVILLAIEKQKKLPYRQLFASIMKPLDKAESFGLFFYQIDD